MNCPSARVLIIVVGSAINRHAHAAVQHSIQRTAEHIADTCQLRQDVCIATLLADTSNRHVCVLATDPELNQLCRIDPR